MVISLPSDRPVNATDECSLSFLPWSESCNGFSIVPNRQDHKTDGLLLMRHMLPAADFNNAIQNTSMAVLALSRFGASAALLVFIIICLFFFKQRASAKAH